MMKKFYSFSGISGFLRIVATLPIPYPVQQKIKKMHIQLRQ